MIGEMDYMYVHKLCERQFEPGVSASLQCIAIRHVNCWRALCTKSVLCEVQIVEHLPSRMLKNLMCDNISGRAAMNGQLGCGSLRQCDLFW